MRVGAVLANRPATGLCWFCVGEIVLALTCIA
jgi:hypothetical protein